MNISLRIYNSCEALDIIIAFGIMKKNLLEIQEIVTSKITIGNIIYLFSECERSAAHKRGK